MQKVKKQLLQRLNDRSTLQVSLIFVTSLLFITLGLAITAYFDYIDQKQVPSQPKEATYKDELLGVNINYPENWHVNTAVNTDSQYEDPKVSVGNIPDIAEFSVIFTKDSTELMFLHFFGEESPTYTQLATTTRTYKVINDSLVRIQSLDFREWYYQDIVDCNMVETELIQAIEPKICISSNFTGFIPGVNRVRLRGRLDSETLSAVDRIVLSAQNSILNEVD